MRSPERAGSRWHGAGAVGGRGRKGVLVPGPGHYRLREAWDRERDVTGCGDAEGGRHARGFSWGAGKTGKGSYTYSVVRLSPKQPFPLSLSPLSPPIPLILSLPLSLSLSLPLSLCPPTHIHPLSPSLSREHSNNHAPPSALNASLQVRFGKGTQTRHANLSTGRALELGRPPLISTVGSAHFSTRFAHEGGAKEELKRQTPSSGAFSRSLGTSHLPLVDLSIPGCQAYTPSNFPPAPTAVFPMAERRCGPEFADVAAVEGFYFGRRGEGPGPGDYDTPEERGLRDG